jgi:hypothetical protein
MYVRIRRSWAKKDEPWDLVSEESLTRGRRSVTTGSAMVGRLANPVALLLGPVDIRWVQFGFPCFVDRPRKWHKAADKCVVGQENSLPSSNHLLAVSR